MEMRGHHVPVDVQYDLSAFGVTMSSDVIRVTFHYNDMLDILGRKVIAGDVLEFPSMRDTPVFTDAVGINRFYEVIDALYSAPGYGQKWFPHIWLVRAKLLTASPEFTEIINQTATGQNDGGVGEGIGIFTPGFTDTVNSDGNPGLGVNPQIMSSLSTLCTILCITDTNIAEAQLYDFFDPKFFESANLYIYIDPDTGYPNIGSNYFSGDGIPPNGAPLVGAGTTFPNTMTDEQYYLRIDYYPARLYQKQGSCFKLIEEDVLKIWTAQNRVLDEFLLNNNVTTLPDGTTIPEKQPLSQILKQRVDLYASRKTKVLSDEAVRAAIAIKNAQNNPPKSL
jgi:hypothetical protein